MHSHSDGCETNNLCFKEPSFGVVEAFTKQLLSDESEVVGDTELHAAEKVLNSAFDGNCATRKKLLLLVLCSFCYTHLCLLTFCTSFPTASDTLCFISEREKTLP